jgi:hypothetical protein
MTDSDAKANCKSDSMEDGPQDSIRAASRDAVRQLVARQSKSEAERLHSSRSSKRSSSGVVRFLTTSVHGFAQLISDMIVRVCRLVPWKALAVTGFLCVVVGGLLWVLHGHYAMNAAQATVHSVWQQMQQPPGFTGDSDSSRFQEQALSDLTAAAQIIERQADTDDQAQKEILWVARDYLPRVVAAGPGGDPEAENMCRQLLVKVAERSAMSQAADDLLVNSLLVFDGLLLAAGCIWFFRKRG